MTDELFQIISVRIPLTKAASIDQYNFSRTSKIPLSSCARSPWWETWLGYTIWLLPDDSTLCRAFHISCPNTRFIVLQRITNTKGANLIIEINDNDWLWLKFSMNQQIILHSNKLLYYDLWPILKIAVEGSLTISYIIFLATIQQNLAFLVKKATKKWDLIVSPCLSFDWRKLQLQSCARID